MKNKTNILIILLIVTIAAATFILNKKNKKAPTGLPTPDAVEINDTLQARALFVDSLSDLVHVKEQAFIVRKGMVDPKTKQFIKPPYLMILDENKKPVPKVKIIL